MSTRQETCFVICCDQCGQVFANEDDGEFHFSTEQAAIDAVTRDADWEVTGGRVMCRECIAVTGCELMGHAWSPWHDAPAQVGPVLWRGCGECGAYDRAQRGPDGLPLHQAGDHRDEAHG